MTPPASILFPTRRRRDYLAVALESVAPQARARGAEVIVVEDDEADAETERVARAAGARYVAHGARLGVNRARNTAIEAAAGELLCLLDDDVEAWPGWLDALLAAAAAHPGHDAFGGPIRGRLEGARLHACGREPPPVTTLDLGPADVDAELVWGANITLRRRALDRAGWFDPARSGAGDEEEWERRLRAAGGRILYVAAAGVDHRRAGADARLPSLARSAYHRGRHARRYDAEKGGQPGVAGEVRTLAGCAWHAGRRRCGTGLVLAAHSAGRLREALDPVPGPAAAAHPAPSPRVNPTHDASQPSLTSPAHDPAQPSPTGPVHDAAQPSPTGPVHDPSQPSPTGPVGDPSQPSPTGPVGDRPSSAPGAGEPDWVSGHSGTLGRRALVQGRIRDAAADLRTARRRVGLRRAARDAPPRRRVHVVGVARPERAGTTDALRRELARSRHEVDVHLNAGVPGAGKWANLRAALAARPPDGADWLLVVDDDVVLPRGFLDTFLHVAETAGLRLAQPAHAFASHAAWPVTRRRPGLVARRTRFVEIGPVTALHRDAFAVLLPFPDLAMGWGLDAHWSAVAAEAGLPLGVVDATPVRHLRPVAEAYPRGAAVAEGAAFLAGRPYVTRAEAGAVLGEWR